MQQSNGITTYKKQGKVSDLELFINKREVSGNIGIGHTRWSTHGEPNDVNAHPHTSMNGKITVIHNGIIENYKTLKKKLEKENFTFSSDTDTEVLANLIQYHFKINNDFEKAVRISLNEVEGAYGIAILNKSEPDKIIIRLQ